MARLSTWAQSGWTRKVFHYSLREPLDWGADCERQMRLMRDLWNVLVEIAVDYRRRYEDAVRNPGIELLEQQLAAAAAALEATLTERKLANAAARKRIDSSLKEGMAKGRADCKRLRQLIKESRRQMREKSPEVMKRLNDDHNLAVTVARQKANAAGCWWSNANAVIASYQRARPRLMREGTQFVSKVNISNRIVNQIIGGMSVADLMAGRSAQVSLDRNPVARIGKEIDGATDSSRKRRWRRLTATVFCGRDEQGRHFRRSVTWPLIVNRHRDIAEAPPESRVQEVHIARSRVADRWEWSVSFLVYVPPLPTSARANGACGIDVGWRLVDTAAGKGVRVATIVSADAAASPSFVVLPPSFLQDVSRLNEIKSIRVEELAGVMILLREIKWDIAPTPVQTASTAVLTLEVDRIQPRYVIPLVRAWREFPDWQPVRREEVFRWARQDRRNWQECSGLYRNIISRRRELYRRAIKHLIDSYGLIGIEDINIANLIYQSGLDGTDPRLKGSAYIRQLAAPGEFLRLLDNAAKRENATIHRHIGHSTAICPSCTSLFAAPDRADLYFTCPRCSCVFDQDVGAAKVLLASAIAAEVKQPSTDGMVALEVWETGKNGICEGSDSAKTTGSPRME